VRLSGAGVVAVLVFAAFAVLALVGSGTAQVVGFVAAIIVAIALVGGVPMQGASAGYKLTSTERGRTIAQAEPDVLEEGPVDPRAWQRERERRERGGAEPESERREGGGAEPEREPVYNPFEAGRG
jgi:hypothetical protein